MATEELTPEHRRLLELAIESVREAMQAPRQTMEEMQASYERSLQELGILDEQGKPTLLATCLRVGDAAGIGPEPGESPESYRDRLIASGIVLDIKPGSIKPRAYVKFIELEIGFSTPEPGTE